MKSIFVAAAALAALTAVPTLAAPAAIQSETATAAAAAATSAALPAKAKSKATKYCISETPTGSRLAARECRTRQEWSNEGVDIDHPNR